MIGFGLLIVSLVGIGAWLVWDAKKQAESDRIKLLGKTPRGEEINKDYLAQQWVDRNLSMAKRLENSNRKPQQYRAGRPVGQPPKVEAPTGRGAGMEVRRVRAGPIQETPLLISNQMASAMDETTEVYNVH